jgi:putative transcriptional regulator
MIKHHPTFEFIQSFVKGDLPASLSAGIAIHCDMCTSCQQHVDELTDRFAATSFEETLSDRFIVDENKVYTNVPTFDVDQMIASITASNDIEYQQEKSVNKIKFKNTSYVLPTVLNNMALGSTAHIGKLTRTRIQLNEDEIHTSLLHIQPGGGVPEHTHKGFELTVLLAGSFHDDEGDYVKGDFIMLDASHQHQPISTDGCLCYTVANDALHFTQGINKLLNPIGSFIY